MKTLWRSQRTGHGNQDDLLVCPLLGGIVVDRHAASVDVSFVFRPWDVSMVKELVSLVQAVVSYALHPF